MRVEHVALWTDDIERCKAFYVTYFGAKAGAPYVNPSKGFESCFLSFDDGARIEVMRTTTLAPTRVEPGAQRMGLTHLAIAVGSDRSVDELTARLRVDGYGRWVLRERCARSRRQPHRDHDLGVAKQSTGVSFR